MCEARVIIEGPDGEVIEEIADVTTIVPGHDRLELKDLFGETRTVEARLKEVRLLDHTVVLTREST